jgi:hypothetical protein
LGTILEGKQDDVSIGVKEGGKAFKEQGWQMSECGRTEGVV